MSGEAITSSEVNNNPLSDPVLDNQFAQEEDLIRIPMPSTINIDNDDFKSNQRALEALNRQVEEQTNVKSENNGNLGPNINKKQSNVLPQQYVKVNKRAQQTSKRTRQTERKQVPKSEDKIQKIESSGQKLNVSVLNPQQQQSARVPLNTKDLEARIKQIAKQIRRKVKKDPPRSMKMQVSEPKTHRSTKIKEKYLTPLNTNTAVKQFNITSPQGLNFSTLKTISGKQKAEAQIQIPSTTIVKNILTRQILEKVNKQIQKIEQAKKVKLKLDPIIHRYPMTSFRKAILKEEKCLHSKQYQREKKKEAKLLKRKQIFSNSRYQRYTPNLKKSQHLELEPQPSEKQPLERQGYKQIEPKQQCLDSNVFSVDLAQEDPENHKQIPPGPQDKNISKPEQQMGVVSSIQQLENIIQDMMYSNQTIPKEEKSHFQQKEVRQPTWARQQLEQKQKERSVKSKEEKESVDYGWDDLED